MRRAAAVALALVLAGCANAGHDQLLSVTATGTVNGFVYFDADGSHTANDADTALEHVRVRLLAAGDTGHVALTATTLADGSFRFTNVPVGRYTVRLDTTTIGAGLGVLKIDSLAGFTLLPGDTVAVNAGVGFPTVSIAAARALPPGRTVFLAGTVLDNSQTFSDSLVDLEDSSGAIRLTRLRNGVAVGDSVRVRGTTKVRDSLPVLDDVHVFPLGTGLIPAALVLTAQSAANADSGRADARLVILKNMLVADTATVPDGFQLTVVDSSGGTDSLEVLLDPAADQTFDPLNAPPNGFVTGSKFNLVGLLEPTGSGTWLLKPRGVADTKKL